MTNDKYKFTKVGQQSEGIDGTDYFYKVERAHYEDIDLNDLQLHVENECFFPSSGAGTQFCNFYEIYINPLLPDRAMVMVSVRYDI